MGNSKRACGVHMSRAAFLSFAFSFGSFSFGEAKENERHVVRTMSIYVLSPDRKLDIQMDR
jgi:hypothetical protein